MKLLTDYLATWWTIMAQPIYFYAQLKEEGWREKSFSFLLVTAWILAVVVTIVIFITQYVPIGATLVDGITGLKFVIILPVLITLAFSFFVITLLIVGGVCVAGLAAAFYLVGLLLHYIYIMLGGRGSLNRMLQCALYSSAVALAGILPAILALLVRFQMLEPGLFRVGFNFILFLTAIFVYGLWAIPGRYVYGLSKTKAFTGALVPFILLLIFGFVFDKIGLRKMETWIAPLK